MARPLLELSVRSNSILDLDIPPSLTTDNMACIWAVFTKFKDNLKHESRLENLSWRLWHHCKVKQEQRVLLSIEDDILQQQTPPRSSQPHDLPEIHTSSPSSPTDDDDNRRERDLRLQKQQQEIAAYAQPHARNSSSWGCNDDGLFISKEDVFVREERWAFSTFNDPSPPEWSSDDDDDDDETVFDEEFQKQQVPRPAQQRPSLLSSMLQQQHLVLQSATGSSSSSVAAAAVTPSYGASFFPEPNLLSESLRYCVHWERQQNAFGGRPMPHQPSRPGDNASWSEAATFIPSIPASHPLAPPPPPPMPWTEPFQGW